MVEDGLNRPPLEPPLLWKPDCFNPILPGPTSQSLRVKLEDACRLKQGDQLLRVALAHGHTLDNGKQPHAMLANQAAGPWRCRRYLCFSRSLCETPTFYRVIRLASPSGTMDGVKTSARLLSVTLQ